MSEKCTLTREERAEAWKLFDDCLEPDELEAIESLMTDYLIYQGKDAKRRCYCTKCKEIFNTVGWPGLRHNDRYYCPNCGADVTLKAFGRLGTYQTMTEKHNVVLSRVAPSGELLISAGLAFRYYQDDQFVGLGDENTPIYPVPVTEYFERRRYCLAPGKIAAWRRWCGPEYSFGHIVHLATETPWEPMKSASEPFPRSSPTFPTADDGMYFLIGRDKIHESSLKYSQVESYFDFAWTEPPSNVRMVVSYLVSYCKRPQIEMLVKLDHADVVEDLLNGNRNANRVNWKAKAPHKFFRLTKSDYKAFSENGGSLQKLDLFTAYKSEFKSFVEFMDLTKQTNKRQLGELRGISEDINRPLREVLRKLQGKSVGTWIDYINMAIAAGYDMTDDTVCFPRRIRERHDALVELNRANRAELESKSYGRRYKALQRRYEFVYDGLRVVIPSSSEDIVEEGQAMHHCVAGYAARHMEGKLDILFLRDAETNERKATIEMNGNHLVQIRGPYNDRNTVPAEERYGWFVDVWLNWVRRGSQRDTAGNPIFKAMKEAETA